MNEAYRKVLLSQLRLAVYRKDDAGKVNDELLTKAVTVNENLASLGYTLNPEDVLRLAVSPSLEGFTDSVSELMDSVKAAPMYPDFPKQVMEMSEAQFRFHQMVHYFSTYGMEQLFGVNVTRGWLPDVKATKKTKRDTRLLALRVLELVDEADMWVIPVQRILAKRERMTLPEQEIIAEAVPHLDAQTITSLQIPFKENMQILIETVFDGTDSEKALPVLQTLCKHTGDVLDNVTSLLKTHKYHFRTAQKRLLVRLIESYPAADWKANIILTDKKAERSVKLLEYLDYGKYSRSRKHMEVVDSLRDGELRSWESEAKALLRDDPEEALAFIAKRPGMLLRMTAWLLRLGLPKDDIARKLCESSHALSTQTLMTVLNFFGSADAKDRKEAADVYDIMEQALLGRLKSARTPFAGKKVWIDDTGYDLALSELKCNQKSAEGGYVPSGNVYKIPDNVKRIRFFCYWNDPTRVDVDLHARAVGLDGKEYAIGWNGGFNECGVIYSGDITHSDAAEYIDVDLSAPVSKVAFNIHLYYGRPTFADVETCFTGLMAVDQLGENVQLYDPANCFYSTQIRSRCRMLQYGCLDVQNRALVFVGTPKDDASWEWYGLNGHCTGRMNVARYLELLLKAQGCERVECSEEADTVLVIEKAQSEKELSLIDNNYFMDA